MKPAAVGPTDGLSEGAWVLGASFSVTDHLIARLLARQLRAVQPPIGVEFIDVFERYAPAVEVLGRLAYSHGRPLIAGGVFDLAQARSSESGNPVLREFDDDAGARFAQEVRNGSVSVTVSVGSLVAAIVAEYAPRGVATVAIYSELDAASAWVHPATDLHVVSSAEVRNDLVVGGIAYDRIMVSGPLPPLGHCEPASGATGGFSVVFDRDCACDDLTAVVRKLERAGVRVLSTAVEPGTDVVGSRARIGRSGQAAIASTVEQARDAVSRANLIVARGSSPLFAQGLACGKPCLVHYAGEDTDMRSVDHVVNAGIALPVRNDGDLVAKVLYLATHRDRVLEMTSRARAMATGRGVAHVVDRVRKLV